MEDILFAFWFKKKRFIIIHSTFFRILDKFFSKIVSCPCPPLDVILNYTGCL